MSERKARESRRKPVTTRTPRTPPRAQSDQANRTEETKNVMYENAQDPIVMPLGSPQGQPQQQPPQQGQPQQANGDGEVQQESMQYPGVLVMRVPMGNGQEEVRFMEVNGLDPLSVPTLLRMAANIKEQQIGLAK